MRISLASITVLVLGIILIYQNHTVKAQDTRSRPRFERIYSERTEGVVDKMTVYYDKETGNEIICAYMSGFHEGSISCFQTGRSWK
jgi:hypothetical protein